MILGRELVQYIKAGYEYSTESQTPVNSVLHDLSEKSWKTLSTPAVLQVLREVLGGDIKKEFRKLGHHEKGRDTRRKVYPFKLL